MILALIDALLRPLLMLVLATCVVVLQIMATQIAAARQQVTR